MAKKKNSTSKSKQKTLQKEKNKKPENESVNGESNPSAKANKKSRSKVPSKPAFPIVGIGASAGGLAAFESFFANMPSDTKNGISFILVQHLDPGHKSILTELVRRYTKMKVYEVTSGMRVEQNCTYIIPPNKDMSLRLGKLYLMEPVAPRGLRLPIDSFFRTLAQDRGDKAICIVLSGTGTDGTLGLRAVKEAGGMAMVQEMSSAGYDGMPRSAIATGLADYILPPQEMPAQLISYVQHAFVRIPKRVAASPPDITNWIQRILVQLRSHNGHDFTYYKQSTIRRRVERRMAVNQIDTMEQYVQFLRQNPHELETLFKELLIGVTGFFRDPDAFKSLKENLDLNLFIEKKGILSLRAWVPGCSTGEEAYSVAMVLVELADNVGKPYNVQIFATDIDEGAIEKARSGVYPVSIAADVSQERLMKFFTQEDDFYRVKKSLRDLVVFAVHDVIKDPPFSKINLVSCRNLLIYMETDLQKKIIPLFHYALKPTGYLFLGNSESIGEFSGVFEQIDRKWKIYRRKEGLAYGVITDYTTLPFKSDTKTLHIKEGQKDKKVNLQDLTEKYLLEDYAPVSVLVNENGDILYIHGRTGDYLELPQGEITTNILRSIREELKLELAAALRKAVAGGETIRYAGLHIKSNNEIKIVNMIVKPADFPNTEDNKLMLVIFEEIEPANSADIEKIKSGNNVLSDKDQYIAALERELSSKEEYLQTAVEELETTNEELKSTNEELQSTNEELQSTNEELETSKEELQSVNEELVTVNSELQQKIDGLSRANNDMNNLLAGTGIGTIFVDHQLCIQRFTPAVTKIVNLIQTDIGRPLSHIVSNIKNYGRLAEDIMEVLENLIPKEKEVQTKNGQWFLMRIIPYRTLDNVIEGAVVTFVEITELKELQETLRRNKERIAHVVNNVDRVLWAIDSNYKLTMANTDFNKTLKQSYNREMKEGEKMPPVWLEDSLRKEWYARYKRALSGEKFREAVISISETGTTLCKEYSFNPIFEAGSVVTGVACIERDITSLIYPEKILTQLADIFNNMTYALIVYNFNGRIFIWNKTAAKIYGWTKAEAIKMNISELLSGKNNKTLDKYLQSVTQREPVYIKEADRITKDGKSLKVESTSISLMYENKKPFAFVSIEKEI